MDDVFHGPRPGSFVVPTIQYRMEGNFGAIKIWRITMNSPNFPHPNILVAKKIANQASN